MRSRPATAIVAALAAAALAPTGCGEPDVALTPPERDGGHVADTVGVLDEAAVEERLAGLEAATGYDVAALVFESAGASLGEAHRGGERLLEAWGADVVLTAVAAPGDFGAGAGGGRRYFGIEADRFTVTRGLRERIVEEAVPGPAAANDWTGAFLAAVAELEAELAGGP